MSLLTLFFKRPKVSETPQQVGLSEETFRYYEESRYRHCQFILDQLQMEGQALVPEESLEWILPFLNRRCWRPNTSFVLDKVEKGILITLVRTPGAVLRPSINAELKQTILKLIH